MEILTANEWFAGGTGGVGDWEAECSVNKRDGERLLSELYRTFP